MKLFQLLRNEDLTGVSGTGIVAIGIVFPSGRCVLEWREPYRSIAIYQSMDDVRAVHGHSGATVIEVFDYVNNSFQREDGS